MAGDFYSNLKSTSSPILNMGSIYSPYSKNSTQFNHSDQDFALLMLTDMIASYRVYFYSIGVTLLVMVVLWALLTSMYLKIHRDNSENWQMLPEFPTVTHARHVIKFYYTGFNIMTVILIPLYLILFYTLGSAVGFLMIVLIGISTLVMCVFLFVLSLFSQIYQLMISYELFKMGKEDKGEEEIEKEHRKRNNTLRALYIVFIIKDLILTPAILIYEFFSMFSRVSVLDTESKVNDTLKLIINATSFPIQCLVPVALFYYATKKHSRGSTKTSFVSENRLQKLIVSEAMALIFVEIIFLVIGTVLLLISPISTSTVWSIIQFPSMLLPMIIQMSTVILFRNNDGVTTSKVEKIEFA